MSASNPAAVAVADVLRVAGPVQAPPGALRDARGRKPNGEQSGRDCQNDWDAIMQRVNRILLAGAALQFVSIMLLAVAAIDP